MVIQRLEAREGGLEQLSTRDLSYREVRDSLWIAGRIAPPGSTTPPENPIRADPVTKQEKPAVEEASRPQREPEPPTEPAPRASTEPQRTQRWTPGPRTMTSIGAQGASAARRRAALARPTVPAMPERRAISRALRPLTRSHPSPWHRVVDEEATAIRAAQDKLWVATTATS